MKISFMTKEEFLTSLSEYPYKKLFVKSLEEAAYCRIFLRGYVWNFENTG